MTNNYHKLGLRGNKELYEVLKLNTEITDIFKIVGFLR